MKNDFETELLRFLRTRTVSFTVKDISERLGSSFGRVRQRDILSFLSVNHLAYPLEDGSYISRAGIFTDKPFSIFPTAYEIQKGVLITGHRCMPFCDPDIFPHEISFTAEKKMVEKVPMEILSSDAFAYYGLLGEEYVPQYLAMDNPDNNREFMQNGFEIPFTVTITVLEMEALYRKWGFVPGDRIRAYVRNWDTGIVEIEPLFRPRENPFDNGEAEEKRRIWYGDMETAFFRSFDDIGPGATMDEQAAYAFFTASEKLLIPECGSLEEFMKKNEKVCMEAYGVETRFWRCGEEIPAVGSWCESVAGEDGPGYESVFFNAGLPVTETILDAYLLDSLYRKEESCQGVLKRILPAALKIPDKQRGTFLLHLHIRRSMLEADYNWFADYDSGAVRSRLLKLYSELMSFICELDMEGVTPEKLPHQSFVVLSQLAVHITGVLDSLNSARVFTDEDLEGLYISIEGMEDSYDETLDGIMEEMKKEGKMRFFTVSPPEEE